MSAKDQVIQLVDYFKKERYLKDKTDAMGDGLMLGANLADEANERSKDATETTLAVQEKYKEQILAQDLNPNKDPELVDLRNGHQTAGERIELFESKTTDHLTHISTDITNQTSLEAAIQTNDRLTLNIGKEIVIDKDLSIPENIILRFNNSGKLHVLEGFKVLLFCSIEAGLWQIFEDDNPIENPGFVGKIKKSYISPVHFGAAGDAVLNETTGQHEGTDNTKAFKQALVLAINTNFYLPSGKFMTGYLEVNSTSNGLKFYGDGIDKTIIISSAISKQSIYFKRTRNDLDFAHLFNFTLSDLTIDGNYTATEAQFSAIYSNAEKIKVINHTGKNFLIDEQVNRIKSNYFFATKNNKIGSPTPKCAIYLRGNSQGVKENYINGGAITYGMLVGVQPDYSASNKMDVSENTFESCVEALIKVEDNIDTKGLKVHHNYVEGVQTDTVVGVKFVGGVHESASVEDNYFTSLAAPAVIDKVDRHSDITVDKNRLFRPVILNIAGNDGMEGLNLAETPNLSIPFQNQAQFSSPFYTGQETGIEDGRQTVIVNGKFGLHELFSDRMTKDRRRDFVRVRGRFYRISNAGETIKPLRFNLGASSNFSPNALSIETEVNYRHHYLTDANSVEIEKIKNEAIVRNVIPELKVVQKETLHLTTEEAAVATVLISSDYATKTIAIALTGKSSIVKHQWVVDFKVQNLY